MSTFTPKKTAALEALVVEVESAASDLRSAIRTDDFDSALAAITAFTTSFRSAYDVLRGNEHAGLLS